MVSEISMKKNSLRHKQLAKVAPHFYLKMLLLALIMIFICSIGLFLEYHWLENYDAAQPISAANRYITRLIDKDYDSIYDEASQITTLFNTKEELNSYLNDKYEYESVNDLYLSEDFACSIDNEDLHCFNIRKSSTETLQTIYTHKVNDQWLALPQMASNTYTIITSNEDVTLTLNGVTVTSSSTKNNEEIFYSAFDNLDNTSNLTLYPNYTVKEVISNHPLFGLSNSDYLAVQDAIIPVIYVGEKPESETYLTYQQLLIDTAQMYCKYITADASLWQLTSLLYPYSEFYDQVRTFENIWFTDHTSIEFNDLSVSNVINLGNDGFLGNIEFDYVVTTEDGNSKVYHTAYQITFINSYGRYLASNIATINTAD